MLFLTKPRFFPLLACHLLVLGSIDLPGSDAPAIPITILRLPGGLRFGLIGDRPAQPAPTLFVLQGSLEVARREPIYTEVARRMAPHGFISVLLDAPVHGEDQRPDEPAELAGWRTRLERGENFIEGFTAKARAVLDYLVQERYADPARVAACGTSRGGFLAFHLAAAEPRIRCIGGIAPVSDLIALREFHGTSHPRQAEALALTTLAPRLAGRPAWVTIGNHDTRIDTERVIAFTRALVQAGAAAGKDDAPVPVELIVNATAGHRSTPRDHELLAAWLLEQFGTRP